MRSVSRFSGAGVALAALLLAGCSSGPKVFVNENPDANIGEYKTYNYEPQLGTDEQNGYRSILSKHLISAMDRELQARGYRKSDNPDMTVNFYVHTKEKVRSTTTPTAPVGGYYGYRRGYYGAYGGYGGYETQVTQYTEGTLNIDLIDSAKDELAWEGVTVGRITDEVRENLAAAANRAVADVLTQYRYTAPGFVPPQPAEGDKSG